ncbi:YceI family protein [Reichenbachiella versicolor]|uniref:YceI family protein n=1 Tax=Reichenbachiella versicolor TaxID=1821036 RepID=UPI000D6DC816|nr:YceI family protein [Reichenbachiella versicolor]
MNIFKTLLFAVLAVVVMSCSKSAKKETTIAEPVAEAVPSLKVKTNGASLKWTAYKFTSRSGVGGTFDTLNIEADKISGTAEEILAGGKITIPTSTVNSNNVIRDPKIKASFFGTFNTSEIKGKILSAADGKGEIEFTMNGMSANTPYTYAVNDTALVVTTAVDVTTWNGSAAIAALNEVCKGLHTGDDGVSKLWPDVDVVLSVPLIK